MVPGYHEIRELGAGGGGRVVLATYAATGAYVAIKYLNTALQDAPGFLLRFREEARVMVELSDPNVVRFYEYYEDATEAAIVMELVDGVALRKILTEHGTTGPEAALVVLKGSLLGLASAHSAGIVHRDYKPENILIQADGGSKLTDFGVAARVGQPDVPAGTPSYMAPEQWTGHPATPATDVYAATCVFFECLTGRKPYRADHRAALMYRHRTAPIPVDAVPDSVRELIGRGMAKNPVDRPPTARAFVAELEAVASAAYGPDWERRGRRHLAELATLLALAFPLARPVPRTSTSIARSVLGRAARRRRPRTGTRLLASVGVITVAITAGLIAAARSADRPSIGAIFTPGPITPSPGGAAPGGRKGRTPAPPPKLPAQVGTALPSRRPDGGTTPGRSAHPASAVTKAPPIPPSKPPVPAPVTTSPRTPPPALPHAVTDLAITRMDAGGATITLRASSPGKVTLTVRFAEGTDRDRLADGPPRGFTLAGADVYSQPVPYAFAAPPCGRTLYRRVTVSTSPRFSAGEPSRTTEVRGEPCPTPSAESVEIISFDGTAVRFRLRTTGTSPVRVRVEFVQKVADGEARTEDVRVLELAGGTDHIRRVAGHFAALPRCGEHVRRIVTITAVPGGGTRSREARLELPTCSPPPKPDPEPKPETEPDPEPKTSASPAEPSSGGETSTPGPSQGTPPSASRP